MRSQGQRTGTITADWMWSWRIQTQSKNPLCKKRIPKALGYLRWFEVEAVHVPQHVSTESLGAYKTRIYNTMATVLRAGSAPTVMRVARKWPQVDRGTVWKNLRDAPVLETTRVARYRMVHDVLPANERLHSINRSPTEACKHCGKARHARAPPH